MTIKDLTRPRRTGLLLAAALTLGATVATVTTGGALVTNASTIFGNTVGAGDIGLARLGAGLPLNELGDDPTDTSFADGFAHVGHRTDNPLYSKTMVQEIATGDDHLAVSSEGDVYAWGYNTDGLLGTGGTASRERAQKIDFTGTRAESEPIQTLRVNQTAAFAITKSGNVVSWGRNTLGQLGQNVAADSSRKGEVLPPGDVDTSGIGPVAAVHPLAVAVLFVGANGERLGAGDSQALNGHIGTNPSAVTKPQPLASVVANQLTGEITASAGWDAPAQAGSDDWWRSNLVVIDGKVKAWGLNYAGETGLGVVGVARPAPAPALLPADVEVSDIKLGAGNAMALTTDGSVFTWGISADGRLGRAPTPEAATLRGDPWPARVALPTTATSIETGRMHDLVLLASRTAMGWGMNHHLQLGFPKNDAIDRPTALRISEKSSVVALHASERFTLAIVDTTKAPGGGTSGGGNAGGGNSGPGGGNPTTKPGASKPGAGDDESIADDQSDATGAAVRFDSDEITVTDGKSTVVTGTGRAGATVELAANSGGASCPEDDACREDTVGSAKVREDGTWKLTVEKALPAWVGALVATQTADDRTARVRVIHAEEERNTILPQPSPSPSAGVTPIAAR